MKMFFTNIIMAFILLTTGTLSEQYFEEFMNDVHENYQSYEVIENEANTNNYYSLKIVRGYYNNELCYGLAFFSENASEYKLVIEQNENLYELNKNDRGDGYALAIKATSAITIHIINDDDVEQDFAGSSLLLKFDQDDMTNIITGNGNGTKFSSLDIYTSKIPYYYAFIYALGVVVFLCGIVLIVMAIRKKGMFNKAARKNGVVNIEELIKEAKEREDVSLWEDFKPEKEEILTIAEEVEEIKDYINLQEYLVSKGFILDYSLMNEDEKNNLMVELMMLKKEKKISEDTYYEETYKLWKK